MEKNIVLTTRLSRYNFCIIRIVMWNLYHYNKKRILRDIYTKHILMYFCFYGDSNVYALYLCNRCKRFALRLHSGTNISAVLEKSIKKRSQILPYRPLNVTIIWICAQPHVNRNYRGIFIFIGCGKRLNRDIVFPRIRAKTGLLLCI